MKGGNNMAKFFDKRKVNFTVCDDVASVLLSMDYEVGEFQKCLESKDIILSKASIIRCLDLYFRIIGLDRPITKIEDFYGLHFASNISGFNDISETSEEVIENCVIFFETLNSIADGKIEIETVKKNMKDILHELYEFCSELISALATYSSEYPTISEISFGVTDMASGLFMISISTAIDDKDVKVFEVRSSVVKRNIPKVPVAIFDTTGPIVTEVNGEFDNIDKEKNLFDIKNGTFSVSKG